MTDNKIVKCCAKAAGIHLSAGANCLWAHRVWPDPDDDGGIYKYDPLTDDAQLMALGKMYPDEFKESVVEWVSDNEQTDSLNRIFCTRITKMVDAADIGREMKCPYCNKDAKVSEIVKLHLATYGGTAKARTACCGALIQVYPVTIYRCSETSQQGKDDWGY